jgi:hypothetical protein
MPTNPVWEARPLLDKLEDPFTMFPVEDVSDTLFASVDETKTRKEERRGWEAPVARKYWSVEDEHDHEKVGLLVGAIFVLGQAAITQTESILNELRKIPVAENLIPKNKERKLDENSATETTTKRSKMVIINAVSNYFKHAYAWPEDWSVVSSNGSQREKETIGIVLTLGMKPEARMTDNLLHAADCLGLGRDDPRALARSIQEWREAWARVLYPALGLPDPNSARSTP